MKNRLSLTIGLAAIGAMFVLQPMMYAGGLTVLTVPWDPTNPLSPHTTYAISPTTEATIVLGATVPSGISTGDSVTVVWHFGDASPDVSTTSTTTNIYDISTTHQYPASAGVGTAWTATVTVTDNSNNNNGSANYYVIQLANASSTISLILSARVNVAIDKGLWYMHQTMWRGNNGGTPPVNWGGWDTQSVACPTVNGSAWDCQTYGSINAANVQAFEVSGHFGTGPATDPFTDDVARGLARATNFLATASTTTPQNTFGYSPVAYQYNPATANYTCKDGSVPTTGDPLCASHGGQFFYNPGATSCLTTVGPPATPPCIIKYDGNSNGLMTYSVDGSNEYTYTTSPFLDALVASGTPTATAVTGPAGVKGATYKDIVQDILDFYGYSQFGYDYDVSEGYARGSYYGGGSWLYSPQQGDDNSTAQWGAIAFISGLRGSGFNIAIPPSITDFNQVWVTNSQDLQQPAPTGTDPVAASDNLGAYGYRGSLYYSNAEGPFAVTPSGMVQMALDGVGRTTNTTFGDGSTNFDQRWNNTETYYADNFCNNPANGATVSPRAYTYGMYSFTKSMLLHNVGGTLEPIQFLRTLTPGVFSGDPSAPPNTIDWYAAVSAANGGTDSCDGVAQTLVDLQNNPTYGVADGHWYGNDVYVYNGGQSPYETAWSLIMLKKTVFVSCINNLAGRGNPSGQGGAQVLLSWTAQANANGYKVLRGTANGGPYTLVGSTQSTGYRDGNDGLLPGTTYYYVVQPVQGTTEICQSNQATVTIPSASAPH